MPSLPTYSIDEIADYLTTGFWTDFGGSPMSYDLSGGRSLSVDITGLTAAGQGLAELALDAWTYVSGIAFEFVSSGAQITFDDEYAGAYAQSWGWGGVTSGSSINISTDWINSYGTEVGSYGFQTYVHEIGHVLGLGHSGDYNGSASYAEDGSGDNHYLNDSWQTTIMSYFAQWENTSIDASYAFVITPQIADINAIQDLYGDWDAHTGDTVWGEGSNVAGYLGGLAGIGGSISFTIDDDGGYDTFDAQSETFDQTIDLRPGAVSDVYGRTGNMIVSESTVIEKALSGAGDDHLIGNDARNWLIGGEGTDTIEGGRFKDLLQGGAGNDALFGQHGYDTLEGGDGADVLRGGGGNDVLKGQAGADTLHGGSGADLVIGAEDGDLLFGNFGTDDLRGYAGNDELRGGAGADILRGGAGDDRLVGGSGDDRLFGGDGVDTFVFTTQSGNDRIEHFDAGSGGDLIGLAAIGAITGFEDLYLNHATETADGVVIDTGGSILISGITLNELSDDNFIFA